MSGDGGPNITIVNPELLAANQAAEVMQAGMKKLVGMREDIGDEILGLQANQSDGDVIDEPWLTRLQSLKSHVSELLDKCDLLWFRLKQSGKADSVRLTHLALEMEACAKMAEAHLDGWKSLKKGTGVSSGSGCSGVGEDGRLPEEDRQPLEADEIPATQVG